MALSPSQIESWREKGFCVARCASEGDDDEGWIFSKEEAKSFAASARQSSPSSSSSFNFGGAGFPFLTPHTLPLNELVLHRKLLLACQQLLRTPSILLSQGELWFKSDCIGEEPSDVPIEFRNSNQRMHMDYPNHYLTGPPEDWYSPEAVAMIVFLDDEPERGFGRTRLVPRNGKSDIAYQYPDAFLQMPGVGTIPWLNDKELAENLCKKEFPVVFEFRRQLYEREVSIPYYQGTVLFYRLDLWHRGTPFEPHSQASRAVMNILYKKANVSHITSWHKGWAVNMYNSWALPLRTFPPQMGQFEQWLSGTNLEQRNALGFPPPGHSYWTVKTVAFLNQRYPHMDVNCYLPVKL